MPSIIRPRFVHDWCELKRRQRQRQWDTIGDRDERLRELNSRYGFFNEDQNPAIGRKTHVDTDYKRAYDEIEADFRQIYDALPDSETDWLRTNDVSTYEYLLLDNYELGDSGFFVEQLVSRPQMNPIEVIGAKAQSFLKRWVEEHRLGGVRGHLRTEIHMFPYAAARCRRFFGISVWDLGRKAEIRQYRRWWTGALEERFDRLKAELP